VKVLRLLRLIKLMRIIRVSRLFRRFEFRMSITYKQLALCRFFVMLVVITHWMANLWALSLVMVDESSTVPQWTEAFAEMEKDLPEEQMTKNQPWKLYIASVYFTSYTLTSVGYGDIGPRNILERIVCTIMIVISGTSWAVVLGQVCGIVANMDADEQAFRTTMDELNIIMREGAFPLPMRQRLRGFFHSNKRAQRLKRHQQHLRNMSPGLQGEVAMQMNRQWISKVSLFKNILQEMEVSKYGRFFYAFVVDISLALRFEVHAQSEMFGAPQVLYILNRGLVSRPPRLFVQGAVWGVDFVLTDKHLLETSESLALTYIELTCLSKEAFFEVVQKYKMRCPSLHRSVRRFCCWLAVQRAIWAEARRRRRKLQEVAVKNAGGCRKRPTSTKWRQAQQSICQLALVPAQGAPALPFQAVDEPDTIVNLLESEETKAGEALGLWEDPMYVALDEDLEQLDSMEGMECMEASPTLQSGAETQTVLTSEFGSPRVQTQSIASNDFQRPQVRAQTAEDRRIGL